MKPILCVDFDGVIHSYASGWLGADVIPDPPVPGAIEFLREAVKHFDVRIFSSRNHQRDGTYAIRVWLEKHDFDWRLLGGETNMDRFPTTKPAAFLTLDDRAMLFTGQFPDPKGLLDFQPWWKVAQGVKP